MKLKFKTLMFFSFIFSLFISFLIGVMVGMNIKESKIINGDTYQYYQFEDYGEYQNDNFKPQEIKE